MLYFEQTLTIWTAAAKGLLAEVQKFVEEGISVNAKGRGDVTPLHEAADAGHTPLVEWLLDNGAIVNARTQAERGYPGAETPFYLAVKHSRFETAKLLLKRGANPNLKSSDGTSPLDAAATSGSKELVMLLVENGARVNGKGESNPLLSALCARHLEIAEYLVSKGASTVVKVPPFRGSLLNLLAGSKWLPAIEFLLGQGLDVNNQDDEGGTPLHSAVISFATRKSETVDTNSGRRKLIITERPEDALPIVRRLLDAGASATLRNNSGLSPLDYAIKIRSPVLIEMLSSPRAS